MVRSATRVEEQQFGRAFLEELMGYIRDTFQPDDVFLEDQLNDWALDNEWIKPADEEPETVFSKGKLAAWAKRHGYTPPPLETIPPPRRAPPPRRTGYNPPPEDLGPPEKPPPPPLPTRRPRVW